MLAQQRQQAILEQLKQQHMVSVTELVDNLDSSLATIRRDLAILESKGLLTRVHGGAVSIEVDVKSEQTLSEKSAEFIDVKRKVAQYAVEQFVMPQMNIFLDAGSAVHAVIPFLANKNCTVFTNGVHHIPLLTQYNIKTFVIGGYLRDKTQAIVGSVALEQIKKVAFHLAVLGTNSVDQTFGCSTPDPEEAVLKTLVIEQSEQTVVLAHYSKFNKKSLYRFAELTHVTLVCDDCPESYTTIPTLYRSNV